MIQISAMCKEQTCTTPAPNEQGLCHVKIHVCYDKKTSHSSTLRYILAGPHQSLVVVTAAPPTPGPPLHPGDAEEVGRMCQQLAQCVGSCDLYQEASSSGRQEGSSSGRQTPTSSGRQEASSSGRQRNEHVASGASTMQVMCYIYVQHTWACVTITVICA